MAIKPFGQLKRNSDDITETPSAKKTKIGDRKVLQNITNSVPTRDIISLKTPLEKQILIDTVKKNSGVIVRANSTPKDFSQEPNLDAKLERTSSLPSNESSPERSIGSPVLGIQETSKLGWRVLYKAQEKVQKSLVETNDHGVNGVRIITAGPPENSAYDVPFDLPFNFYSSFDAYTSESDNLGISPESLADLWIFQMRHLITMVNADFFPNCFILHGIVKRGLRHNSLRVRQICNEYLNKLLCQVHPPRNTEIRLNYLNVFFKRLPDQGTDLDFEQAWETFSSILEENLKTSCQGKSNGSYLTTTYFVRLLEVDVQFWYERYVKVIRFLSTYYSSPVRITGTFMVRKSSTLHILHC